MALVRFVFGSIVGALALAGGAWAAPALSGLDWAFPGKGAATASASHADPWASVAGTPVRYRKSVIEEHSAAIDWRPGEHGPLPPVVAKAKPGAYPCGYCHLPNGQGRPENANLAGLPADYIRRQVAAFAAGERRGARPDWGPTALMIQLAKTTSASDLAEAAAYFSRQSFHSRVKVVEAEAAPAVVPRGFVYARAAGRPSPLGRSQIVEGPRDMDQFELRDPHTAYVAYVPRGAVARGAALARSGGPAGQGCAACHGAGLGGGVGPPLAGRSSTYLFRQLLAFKSGGRRGSDAAPMITVAAGLTPEQMVDLAAYAASRTP